MKDKYLYKQADVESSISNLKTIVESYNKKIVDLNNIVVSIQASTLWKDEKVKTAFIETCNSYITVYQDLVKKMRMYVRYLTSKSNGSSQIETAFSR